MSSLSHVVNLDRIYFDEGIKNRFGEFKPPRHMNDFDFDQAKNYFDDCFNEKPRPKSSNLDTKKQRSHDKKHHKDKSKKHR